MVTILSLMVCLYVFIFSWFLLRMILVVSLLRIYIGVAYGEHLYCATKSEQARNWFICRYGYAIYWPSFVHIADDGPGSLRDGCRKKEPLWIIFDVSGTIELSSYINVSSYKTVDGRGQRVKLTGKGLRLKECEHVIICNLLFEGGRGHDVDGIQIKPNSKHIWIDRCSLSDYDDGLIDITRQSTDITVSRSAIYGFEIKIWLFLVFGNCLNFSKLHAGVTFRIMIKPCSLVPIPPTRMTDAYELPFTIVSSMGHGKGSHVSDLGKYICIIIILETGEFMLFVPV